MALTTSLIFYLWYFFNAILISFLDSSILGPNNAKHVHKHTIKFL